MVQRIEGVLTLPNGKVYPQLYSLQLVFTNILSNPAASITDRTSEYVVITYQDGTVLKLYGYLEIV